MLRTRFDSFRPDRQPRASDANTNNTARKGAVGAMADDEMRDEYDFSGGVRGKYAARYAEGTNIVVLDRDVAEIFPTSQSVNDALRALATVIRNREKAST